MKSANPPSFLCWVREVLAFLPLEKLRYSRGESSNRFHNTWSPFLQFADNLPFSWSLTAHMTAGLVGSRVRYNCIMYVQSLTNKTYRVSFSMLKFSLKGGRLFFSLSLSCFVLFCFWNFWISSFFNCVCVCIMCTLGWAVVCIIVLWKLWKIKLKK